MATVVALWIVSISSKMNDVFWVNMMDYDFSQDPSFNGWMMDQWSRFDESDEFDGSMIDPDFSWLPSIFGDCLMFFDPICWRLHELNPWFWWWFFVRLPPHPKHWHSWFIVFLQAILSISPTLCSLPSSRWLGFNLWGNPAAVGCTHDVPMIHETILNRWKIPLFDG